MTTGLLPALLFGTCAAAIAAAQVGILASTVRGMRARRDGTLPPAPQGSALARHRPAVEWAYALGPIPVLAFLLWQTWLALPR